MLAIWRDRSGKFGVNPIPLANGTEFILPLAVLTDPAFDSLKPSLNNFQQREVTHDELVQAEP